MGVRVTRPWTAEELLERVDTTDPEKCWIWQRGRTTYGYGHVRKDDRDQLVHRLIYELLVGPIPGKRSEKALR